jgi:hypothetical protein
MKRLIKNILRLMGALCLATGLSATDFNNDGHADMALYNSTTRQTAIWLLNNTTFLGGMYGPTIPTGWSVVGEGDFNKDGQVDLLLYSSSNRATAIWYLSAGRLIGGAYGPTAPAGWTPVAVGDFNHDGYPDIVFQADDGRTAVWFMKNNVRLNSTSTAMPTAEATMPDGGGLVAPTVSVNSRFGPTLPAGWLLLATADFDGDGVLDFCLYNPVTRATAIWSLDQNLLVNRGAFGPTIPPGWSLDEVADFNNDGHPDYLLNQNRVTAFWYLIGLTLKGGSYGPSIPAGWQPLSTAKTCAFSVAPQNAAFTKDGGDLNIYVSALNFGCTWTSSTPKPWLHIVFHQGTNVGSTYITVHADANNTGSPQFGSILVAGHAVSVSQAGPINYAAFDGNWSGSLTGTSTSGSCSYSGSLGYSLNITVDAVGNVTGSTVQVRPCFTSDCGISDFPNASGNVTGNVTSATTIAINWSITAPDGGCAGQSDSGTTVFTLSGGHLVHQGSNGTTDLTR